MPDATAQLTANGRLTVILRNITLPAMNEAIEVAVNSRNPIDQIHRLKQRGFRVSLDPILYMQDSEQAGETFLQLLLPLVLVASKEIED